MAKAKVFVDSSVFIAALLSRTGGSFYILTTFHDHVQFCTNDYVIEEVERILKDKFRFSSLRTQFFLLLGIAELRIDDNPSRRKIESVRHVIAANDAPILAGALSVCDYLLTLDNDFFTASCVDFSNMKGLRTVKPREFIQSYV